MRHDPIEEVLELLSDGQRAEALALLEVVLREEPWQGPLFALRGLICAESGNLDEAAAATRHAREISPDHPFVHYAAAAVALQEGSVRDAIHAAQAAQHLSPGYAEAALLEARARVQLGQWDRVRAIASTVAEREPDNEEAALLNAIAADAGSDRTLDSPTWQRLGERFPLNPIARTGAGWTHLLTGQIPAARAEFEQALAMDPSLSWAKEGLATALKARNPVYALLLRFFLWFGRLQPRTRTLILIGGFLGYNTLRRTAALQPELRPLIVPVLVLYLAFVVLSWLADPLMNLLLMARPEGRRLLEQDQQRTALLVGGCLALGTVLGIAGGVSDQPRVALAGLGVGLASFAMAAAGAREGRRRRQFHTMAAIAVTASLASLVAPEAMAGALFLGAVLCTAAATWLSNFASDGPKRRAG
ncbi:MAG TPA: tetratricopeptide repeat protein [Gemmatimonadales bacterium]|nr:tetratricopeptide repeat protein [Gemmatimonadales bacterium]